MTEDQLTHDERLRLEAFVQVNVATQLHHERSIEHLIDDTEKLVDYLTNGKKDKE